jgi:TIR domain
MSSSHFEKSKDSVHHKLEFLVLKKYAFAEDINSDDFQSAFEDEFYPFQYADAKKVLTYLHGSGYLESAPGKFHVLRITNAGREKYKLEAAARGRFALFDGKAKYTTYAEREQFALECIEKLFLYFASYIPFQIHDAIKEYSIRNQIKYEDTLDIKSVQDLIEELLLKDDYVERVGPSKQLLMKEKGHKKLGLLIKNYHTGNSETSTKQITSFLSPDRRLFDIALSFPGEARPFVERVVGELQKEMDSNQLFYDSFYEAFLARPNLNLLLAKIYQEQSKLIVVFLSADYQRKPWCGIEFRSVQEIIFKREHHKVMYIRLDNAPIDGVLKTDGYIDARKYTPIGIAHLILQRFRSL